jgi:hypothetical protein
MSTLPSLAVSFDALAVMPAAHRAPISSSCADGVAVVSMSDAHVRSIAKGT